MKAFRSNRGYKKGTHKPDCKCPICRNARGERKKLRRYVHITLPEGLIQALKRYAEENGVSIASVTQAALEVYLIEAQE